MSKCFRVMFKLIVLWSICHLKFIRMKKRNFMFYDILIREDKRTSDTITKKENSNLFIWFFRVLYLLLFCVLSSHTKKECSFCSSERNDKKSAMLLLSVLFQTVYCNNNNKMVKWKRKEKTQENTFSKETLCDCVKM